MSFEYILFTSAVWLAPVALVTLTITAIALAIKNRSISSVLYALSAVFLLGGLGVNYLAISVWGQHSTLPNGGVQVQFEPALRIAGLMLQVTGYAGAIVASALALRTDPKTEVNRG